MSAGEGGAPAALSGGARLGLLAFLWGVLAALTWLALTGAVPHLSGWGLPGWLLLAFMATVFVSLYLGAATMSRRLVRGEYVPGAVVRPAGPGPEA
jgi:hypothetical protein